MGTRWGADERGTEPAHFIPFDRVRMNLIGKEMAGLWKKRNAIIQRRDILVLATRSLCRQLAMGSPARGSDSSAIDVLRMAFGWSLGVEYLDCLAKSKDRES